MGSTVPTLSAVRTLYKQLARYGQGLVFTDRGWYNRRLREEFNKPQSSDENLEFAYRKGLRFLEFKRLI